MVMNMDARKVEPSGVDTHKRGGVPLIVGVAPALAEGTVSVEPTIEAEKATASKPEALVPLGARCNQMQKSRCYQERTSMCAQAAT